MRPSPWPDELEEVLLAKSADRGKGGRPESLAQHTWLVLSRLADFIHLRPTLPTQLKRPRLWHVLYWAVFLHDFGKAMPGFQGVLRGDQDLRDEWAGHRHEVFSLAFLDWIINGLSDKERLWTAAAIVAHHKDANEIAERYPRPEPGEPEALLAHFAGLTEKQVNGLHKWLVTSGWQWAQTLALDEVGVEPVSFVPEPALPFTEYGARQIRHWLSRYSRFIRRLNRERDASKLVPLLVLRGTIINADHSASAHADPLPIVEFDAQEVLASRGIAWEKLFAHQADAYELEGSALLTAPTGSGKTEAALLWAARQGENGQKPPRLFYTLPYQASMNAMQLRLQETFGNERVGLQHGRSLLALYRWLMDRDYNPRQAAIQAKWMRNLAELNYPPVRVFSPYQMLKGMYRLKGYEAKLTDYHNALFIFDEIHAYEVKRLALILKSIEYLRRHYNARFFVMSATFPTLIKEWLADALDSPVEIIARSKLFQEFQRHQLDVIEGDLLGTKHLERIVEDAQNGKSVLVVCNLVARAQEAYGALSRWLGPSNVEVELLHGNFNLRDCLQKEKLVRESSGAKSQRRRPVVLVATQVVEVSLDIDLNTIYTDPAPLEALVQRFGRINRRRKLGGLAPVHVFTQPDDGQKIYDERLIAGTLRVLRREDGQPVDEASVGNWLDEIYEGEVAEVWRTEFTKAAEDFENAIVKTLRPFHSDEFLRQQFYEAFDGVEVLPDCYWDEYDELKKERPIEAKQLLVSISWGRLHQLRGKRLILTEKDAWPIVVDVPYSSEQGLDFRDI